MSVVDAIVERASHRSPGADANVTIEAARSSFGSEGAPAVSYEIALPALAPDTFLLERALPRLVYFLDCRGCRLPEAPGVFVSLFAPAGLFCVDARAVVELLAAARGLSMHELRRRYGASGVGDPLTLGA